MSFLRQAKYIDILPSYNTVTYQEGRAHFTADGATVDGEPIKAGRVIIATGAAPAMPSIPGIESVPYLTSTTALELVQLPKSLLVNGGGYIGCELGQMFARAEVKVTIVARRRLLPEAEPEISLALTRYFTDESITVRDGVSYQAIEQTPDSVVLTVVADERVETISAEQSVPAAGPIARALVSAKPASRFCRMVASKSMTACAPRSSKSMRRATSQDATNSSIWQLTVRGSRRRTPSMTTANDTMRPPCLQWCSPIHRSPASA